MKKTVLITGVAGLLGSRLADWIVENQPEYQVIGVDDLSGGYKENVNSEVEFFNTNIIGNNISLVFEKYNQLMYFISLLTLLKDYHLLLEHITMIII